MQQSTLVTVVREIVEAAGMLEMFDTADKFELRLEQDGYDPLVIQSMSAKAMDFFGEKRWIFVDRPIVYEGVDVCTCTLGITDGGVPLGFEQPSGHISVVDHIPRSGLKWVNLAAWVMVEKQMDSWAQTIRDEDWIIVARKRNEPTGEGM